MKKQYGLALIVSFVAATAVCAQDSQAARAFLRGPSGAAGAFAGANQYGSRAGARAWGANNGIGFRGGQLVGPQGGTLQTAGGFGYRRGVGAVHAMGWQGQNAHGSGYGATVNQYNAQTGQGVRNRTEQIQNASGQDYGFNATANYAKGQGVSDVIQTDNHGTFDLNYGAGQVPTLSRASQ